MKVKINLGRCRKTPTAKIVKIQTQDFIIASSGYMIEFDELKSIPTGFLIITDLYGNKITLHQSSVKYIIPYCATEILKKGKTSFLLHPPHNYISKGELITEETTLQNTVKGLSKHPNVEEYPNLFSIFG